MAKIGKRYPLLIYEYTLSRWYPATLAISIFLFILWWFQPRYLPKPETTGQDLQLLIISGLALLMTIFLFLMRKAAYVRPHKKHLRLVTPFLRINISYKRIIQTRATEMSTLFPSSTINHLQRESIAPLLAKTAIVVKLNEFPIPLPILRFFLSPLFFKDKTPHIVLLVDNWMRFSTELESLRTGGDLATQPHKDRSSLLSSLSGDDK